MNQQSFEQAHQAQWSALEQWLDQRGRGATDAVAKAAGLDLPRLYRQVCHHLALAKDRRFSPHLIDRLNSLVLRGHQALYQRRDGGWRAVAGFLTGGFPALVRAEGHLVAIASALFFGPLLALLIGIQLKPELVYSVIGPFEVQQIEQMYNPDVEHIGRERQADTDFAMFGYYIRNNITIGFQTFAGGLLAGLGTVFFLVFNGVFIGAIAGHLTHVGFVETFWGFVAGHSAPELIAIAMSGAAGLRLALALLRPGRRSRLDALRLAGRRAVKMVGGAFVLFAIAAVVEAFWSSSSQLPLALKYGFGIGFWVVLLVYFGFAGRGLVVEQDAPG